jgi:hypothetical protein
MSLVVSTMPNAVAPAAHSSMQSVSRASGPASTTNTSQNPVSSMPASQVAAMAGYSSSDKSRTTTSRPNQQVDKGFSSEKEKARSSQEKEGNQRTPGRLNISA